MKIDRAVLEINGGCNYKCEMCPQTNPKRDRSFLVKMPLDTFEDQLKQQRPNVVNLDGSGEATLNRDLPRYIELVKKYDAKCHIFSNGYNFGGKLASDSWDAGLDLFRFSIIGYNEELYCNWMGVASMHWDKVMENLYTSQLYYPDKTATYHLITDNKNIDHEVDQYLALVKGGLTEIWKMHNWSGVYKSDRKGGIKTCGRPFSPDSVVRANGAVHPCCQVLGRDVEATLGNIYHNTFEEIWNGPAYEALREGHRTGNYPSFCKDCDFLIQANDVLVYSNHAELHKMHGADFSLREYQ